MLSSAAAEDPNMPLVVVPTPLGNLGDITLRALDTLRSCELIAAEDTRTARKLLALLGLAPKPTWSYREQNAAAVTSGILERARTSLVAVVSDAGMPGISDPGSALVAAAREAGIPVDVLPGACAFVTAAVLSGFPLTHLSFEGFVPRAKGERERALRAALASGAAAPTGSQILPVIVGDDRAALVLAAGLQRRGFDVRAIRPPTVPVGTARLRISITLNVDEQAARALFAALAAERGVLAA